MMSILDEFERTVLIDRDDLMRFVATAPYRYKKYQIPKRNGSGFRNIAQPTKELKFLQRTIVKSVDAIRNLPIHGSSMAYRINLNIRDNALVHSQNSYLLKMDFSNFFPSIIPNDLLMHINIHTGKPIENDDVKLISNLFFYKRTPASPLTLSIGAPSSPFLSNTLMFEFDRILTALCEKISVIYTRYADDLVFSTNNKNVLFDLPKNIENVLKDIQYPRLSINEEKTIFLSKKDSRRVTGLVISNDGEVGVGRKRKRYIKSLVFKYVKEELDETEIKYLSGYLRYCHSVDRSFVSSLKSKYGAQIIDTLFNYQAL